MPVATADRPSATDRNSGTTKKIPACTRNRKKNEVTPSRSWMLRSIFGSISAAWPRCDAPVLPHSEQAEHHTAREHEPDHRREPEPLGSIRLGLHEPPRTRAQDADHDQHRGRPPTAPVPTRSSLAPFSAGVSFTRRARARITITISDLADEHPPPRGVGREQAADHRPRRAAAIAPAAATSPYARGRSDRPKFDATSATIAGMINTAPMPSRNDQPMISTVRL